jgi:predicted DNA-binding transcriptional regulator AlpA
MHIWRLLSLEAYRPLQFPRPTKINGRNYWSLREVNAWIRQRFDASRHAQAA